MVNQHFFKPLLPGFHTHLKIPVAFFLKNIEERNEKKTMKLRSDASKISWEVKIDDQRRLTGGWKEFALAHDLQIGDIVIFRQEKDMTFHVTILGSSCCEIQYESHVNNLEKIERNKKVNKNPKRETGSSSQDLSCFVANVTPSSLREEERNLQKCSARKEKCRSSSSEHRCVILTLKPYHIKHSKLVSCSSNDTSKLQNLRYHHHDTSNFENLPMPFTRMNGINEETKMSLLDKHGVKWSTNLRSEKKYERIRLLGGWKNFFKANSVKTGESVMLKLIWEEDMSCVLKFCSKVKQENI